MFGIGVPEMIIIGILGVLLFGKRLPEVGRSLGKGLMEFKKGVSGVQEELERATSDRPMRPSYSAVEDREEATAPRFEPPAEEPVAATPPAAEPPTHQTASHAAT
jgi:sec-independent protein translocase protein TatA